MAKRFIICEMSEVMSTDYWLSPEHLLHQPKREVADYVESQGIANVPRRFESLHEALGVVAGGGVIVLRSEHPSEHAGPSGLTTSHTIDMDKIAYGKKILQDFPGCDIDIEIVESSRRGFAHTPKGQRPGYGQVEDMIIGDILAQDEHVTTKRLIALDYLNGSLGYYAYLLGGDREAVQRGMSLSYWEYIPGTNVTIVADDAVDGRYHILHMTHKPEDLPTQYGGSIVNEGGETIRESFPGDLGLGIGPELGQALVKQYEQVRNLPRFASEHCPVMEMQVDHQGNTWFLQYHRARDFEAPDGSIDINDYPESDGWQRADAVRGWVDSPVTLNLALWYPENYGDSPLGYDLPLTEDASVDWHYNMALTEVLSRRRTAYVEDSDFNGVYQTMAAKHDTRSKWFKPKVAVAIPDKGLNSLLGEGLKQEVLERVHKKKEMVRVVIDLASDGEIGYIRLSKDVESQLVSEV
jgi:hypothetical protein